MSQQDKGRYYRALKNVGVEPSKPYREYTEAELLDAIEKIRLTGVEVPIEEPAAEADEQPAAATTLPVARAKPGELAGERLNLDANDELTPIRQDPDTGYIWYQEEVRKPLMAQPRGRRVLRYSDTGTETRTLRTNDGMTETFEVAGRGAPRSMEVKVTLPSYQVGIYYDRRFPFKLHIYNEIRGFDFFEVNDYYGGEDMVPAEIKRMYVENVLCYDIRTVVRAIETEARELALQGRL